MHAASVDGATIIDWLCTVHCLGAKLHGVASAIPESVRSWLKAHNKATRHASMAACMAGLEDAVGLVVSSDGEATLFAAGPDAPAPMSLLYR